MTENITAQNTLDVLRRYILLDGFPVVFDVEKSRGPIFSMPRPESITLISSVSLPAILWVSITRE